VHDGGYAAVIVSGGSHRLSRALLALGWGVLYPGEAIIRVFPLGDAANRMLYKHEEDEAPDSDGFEWWLHANLPELEASKHDRLVFVDDFALTGEKFRGVRTSLAVHGFRDVRFAFFAAPPGTELTPEAYVGTRDDDAVAELHRLSQHIQGKEGMDELLDEVKPEADRLRTEALDELRGIGRAMR
jgi:hypothetical protein